MKDFLNIFIVIVFVACVSSFFYNVDIVDGAAYGKLNSGSVPGWGPNDDPIGFGENRDSAFDILILVVSWSARFIVNLIPTIAMMMVAYAGFQYTRGSLDQKASGKQTLMYAIGGFIFATMAYFIVSFILGIIIGTGA